MSPQLLIFACVLQTVEGGAVADQRCDTPYVHELVTAISKHCDRTGVPAHIEVAKIWHESKFNKHARGSRGEVGLSQLLRHGAIQGADLKLTRAQLEDVDTNIRIGTEYLAQFVRQCDRPSRWLTKYNRPARGCRPSRYSLGVLADLRAARRVRLSGSTVRLSYDSEASGWGTLLNPSRSPSMEMEHESSDRTSYKEVERSRTTVTHTRERLPSGRRRSKSTESKLEEELAAPFAEP